MTEAENTCYLCGEKSLESLQDFSWLVKCRNCGFVYNPNLKLDPREVAHLFYDDANVEHRKKIQNVLLNIAHARWIWLNRWLTGYTGHLLEVGCGTGEFLIKAKLAGWEVDGLELSESFRIAAKNWYDLELRGDELSQAGFEENSFEIVALFHVFEHLLDPLAFLGQVSRVLKPGGWLFIIVPNISSWTDNLFGKSNPTLIKKDHYFHYTPCTLQNIITRSFFDVVEVITHEPSHHIWTSFSGFLALKIRASRNGEVLINQSHDASPTSKIKSNIPYWLGSLVSICLFPFRFWLEKVNKGHEVYLLCRRR